MKKRYTEFLGIRIKAVKKEERYAVRLLRIKDTLKEQACRISRPQRGRSEYVEINRYNAMVMGQHNYYRMATHVNLDFNKIAHEMSIVFKCRLGDRLKKKGEVANKVIRERYGGSKQIRFVSKHPIVPVGYVQTKPPRCKKRSVNAYTPQGRVEIHKDLGIHVCVLHNLMRSRELHRSIEFMDNRLSLYCAQYGECAVTGRVLQIDEMHCHHKLPKRKGGKDRYANLVIVHVDVHHLIHATDQEIIDKYRQLVNLGSKAMKTEQIALGCGL